MALTQVIEQLQNEVKTKMAEINSINKAVQLLKNGKGGVTTFSPTTRKALSPESVEKIRAAQIKRWAIKKKTPTSNKGS